MELTREILLEKIKEVNPKTAEKLSRNCDFVIITAGPSLKKLCKNELLEFTRDKVIITVKQAIEKLDYLSDIHIINDFNYKYDKKIDSSTYKVKVTLDRPGLRTPGYNEAVKFFLTKTDTNIENSLATEMNFHQHGINSTINRPLGPGIMYELAIYIPILFGCQNLFIIGWDIGSRDTDVITRFYQSENIISRTSNFIFKNFPSIYNRIWVRIRNLISLLLFYLGFKKIRLNDPGYRVNESQLIANSTEKLGEYLKSKNINVFIISDQSLVSEKIPRLCIV